MNGREPAPRFFVETWGCQMNELDSRRLAGQLVGAGMLPTSTPAEADVILLNSCSVREKAEQKVYSRLGEYRLLKRERPGLRIGLCGCVAQQEGERALSRVSDLDFVLGPARVGELGSLLPRIAAGERLVATGFPAEREYALDTLSRADEYKGMVTAIEGCDKRCTFCIVPYTRGPERCRPLADVVADARHLLAHGFVEIELLGQTVNHWRDPDEPRRDFVDLVDAVADLPGLRRLRFVTSYPRDFTPRMVDLYRRHERLCDYLHLPVQSGSDRILRRMGRGYQVAEYLRLVSDLRAARPRIALSTDFIAGFPGETEEEFRETLDLVESVRFAALFAFCYSPRPGTPAAKLTETVPEGIAKERLARLLELQDRIQSETHAGLVGREFELLVTGWSRQAGRQSGRTSCNRIVHFEAGDDPVPPGAMTRIRVSRALPHSLLGDRLATPSAATDSEVAPTPPPPEPPTSPGRSRLPIVA